MELVHKVAKPPTAAPEAEVKHYSIKHGKLERIAIAQITCDGGRIGRGECKHWRQR